MNWTITGGYAQEHRLVNSSGRIVGVVGGSVYNDHGWNACVRAPDNVFLGTYVSAEQARQAVEESLAQRTAQNEPMSEREKALREAARIAYSFVYNGDHYCDETDASDDTAKGIQKQILALIDSRKTEEN